MLIELSVKKLLEEIASSSPIPGGGSVSALVSALASALAIMVSRLTSDNKKFLDDHQEMYSVQERTERYYRTLLQLVDEDAEAFKAVMASYKMPKTSETEKTLRSASIQSAYHKAVAIPLEVTQISVGLLKDLVILSEKGNPSAISDVGVAVHAAWAGLSGASLSIKSNLPHLREQGYAQKVRAEVDGLIAEGALLKNRALKTVMEKVE